MSWERSVECSMIVPLVYSNVVIFSAGNYTKGVFDRYCSCAYNRMLLNYWGMQ